MPLDDVEGTAEDVGERARLFEVVRFQVNRDDHVRAKKQNALDGHRRGDESVDQRPPLKLNGHKKAGISAGSAQRWSDGPMGIVDGNTGGDVRGGDGQRRLQFLKRFYRSKTGEGLFQSLVCGETGPGRLPTP